jgi:DNA-binding NarL/FixJ family response regulator
MKVISLLIIGDEAIARVGLKHLLASDSGFEVRGEASSIDAIEHATNLKPDVLIVFAEPAGSSCVRLVKSICKAIPRAAIVILGRENHHAYVGLLLASGALAYVLLRAKPRELFGAIRTAAHGGRYIDPALSEEFFELLTHQAASGTKVLSQREQQVLTMIAHGFAAKEIAFRLNVSRKSIETYRARSRNKLGLKTRADIVRYAIQTGLLAGNKSQAR